MEKELLTIEQMSRTDIVDALKHVIENKGYIIRDVLSDRVFAEKANDFDKTNECFYVVDSAMSGLNDSQKKKKIEQIANALSGIRGKIYIVSNHTISNDFEIKVKEAVEKGDVSVIGRDHLIKLLKSDYPEFWKHGDDMLSGYESDFLKKEKEDTQLLALKINSDKYERILNITLQPSLFHFYEDAKTGKPIRKRINIDDIVADNKSVIVEGISGSGKSTLLKRIGCHYIAGNGNIGTDGTRNIPIFISTIELNVPNFDVEDFVKVNLSKYLGDIDLAQLLQKNAIRLLIDSIDEFGEGKQKSIIKSIRRFERKYPSTTTVIGTRQSELLTSKFDTQIPTYQICNLNIDQIKKFIQAFIPDELKSNSLLEGLRQNKILERIPMTPLTLSLITLLFEEKNYEIPATVTDLYDNFHQLIHGRPFVSEKLEFIEITFRERILSMYGLYLMRAENHQPLSKEEFIAHFVEIFKEKSPDIKGGTIEDALNYIIDNTGILYLKDTKWIAFAHPSYMEYYASREIFNYERESEAEIIHNFFDLNWQNVAVFYAGRTKDMPYFVKEVEKKSKSSHRLSEYLAVVQGCGYLLQALYLTDNRYKKDVVLTVLDKLLECYEGMKKMASDEVMMFKAFSMPILMLLNIFHFYEMFNSITLRDTLQLSFKELMAEMKAKVALNNPEVNKQLPGIGFKLLNLGLTLNSPQLATPEPLTELTLSDEVLSNPSLVLISNFSSELILNGKAKLDDRLKKRIRANSAVNKALTSLPMSKFRYSTLDDVKPQRPVKLIVEGDSDAIILEHAFMVLTEGRTPYWTVEMASTNGSTGSSESVKKAMEIAPTYAKEYEHIIGLLDCDAAGIKTFRYLDHDFEEQRPMSLKTHRSAPNVHVMLLPVPGEMAHYLKNEQELNYFEIEHLFGHDYLRAHGMLEESELQGEIYKIRDKSRAKTDFAHTICDDLNPDTFIHFADLFRDIDAIVGIQIEYAR